MKKTLGAGIMLAPLAATAICVPAIAVHSRPGDASPLRVPLVNAYQNCTAPNTVHVAPLTLPSCTPPVRESTILTTGNSGAMRGFARFTVFCTDGDVPPCDLTDADDFEDVAVNVSITDVRCVTTIAGCSAPGADYTGQVIEQTVMRITDHANAPDDQTGATACPNGAGDPPCTTATLSDITFSFPIFCAPTGGSGGSTCDVLTTLDSMVPNFVKEQQRGVVAEFGHSVLDAGFDGEVGPACPPVCGTGDERRYLNQGMFAP